MMGSDSSGNPITFYQGDRFGEPKFDCPQEECDGKLCKDKIVGPISSDPEYYLYVCNKCGYKEYKPEP